MEVLLSVAFQGTCRKGLNTEWTVARYNEGGIWGPVGEHIPHRAPRMSLRMCSGAVLQPPFHHVIRAGDETPPPTITPPTLTQSCFPFAVTVTNGIPSVSSRT